MSIKLPRIHPKPPLKQKENLSQTNIDSNSMTSSKARAFSELEKNLFDKLESYSYENQVLDEDADHKLPSQSHKKNSVSNV